MISFSLPPLLLWLPSFLLLPCWSFSSSPLLSSSSFSPFLLSFCLPSFWRLFSFSERQFSSYASPPQPAFRLFCPSPLAQCQMISFSLPPLLLWLPSFLLLPCWSSSFSPFLLSFCLPSFWRLFSFSPSPGSSLLSYQPLLLPWPLHFFFFSQPPLS